MLKNIVHFVLFIIFVSIFFILATINVNNLLKFREAFYSDAKNVLAQNACSRVSPTEVSTSRNRVQECHHYYTNKV